MRIITYEIILPLTDEETLLGNGLYGAFDIVTKEVAEKISAGNFISLSPALESRLLRRGHLIQKKTRRKNLSI